MLSGHKIAWTMAPAVLAMLAAGCAPDHELGWWNWFDPSKPIRKPNRALIKPIYNSIGPTDQTQELAPNATMPTPQDLVPTDEDYVIGPSDYVRVRILDLFNVGQEAVVERQVEQSGYIDLPQIRDQIRAAGLTGPQLTEAIRQAYMPDILRDPTVSVNVLTRNQSLFYMLGAVGRPGMHQIPRRDYTLLEALATAGDVTQATIDWVYIIRPKKGLEILADQPQARRRETPPPAPGPGDAPRTRPNGPPAPDRDNGQEKDPLLEELEPFVPGQVGRQGRRGSHSRLHLSQVGSSRTAPATPPATGPAGGEDGAKDLEDATEQYQWIYSGGQWIRVRRSATETRTRPALPPPTETERDPEDPFGWMSQDMGNIERVIAIDLDKLKSGDPRMNVIVRDNDIIHVPPLEVGEFYVMGEVARPGVYSLTGRRITAKMAVAAAGNLGALAWPNNSVLIRRVGRDQEQVIPLPLQDIFAGREPDVFLKPDDVIAVGTHWSAPFLAVWRNAFRMTYGFGFIYDRNYSEREFEIPILYPQQGRGFR
jgi:protein involved in polysaccharide export with SLBB domain